MTWYVAVIAKESVRNWQLCKDIGLWGISTSGRPKIAGRVRKGDKLVVWQSGAGWIAYANVTADSRAPIGKEETPWGGGLYRFGLVVPTSVVFEPKSPKFLPFKDRQQTITGLPLFTLRRGFSMIPDEIGKKILREMRGTRTSSRTVET
jgi:hypothetical protein